MAKLVGRRQFLGGAGSLLLLTVIPLPEFSKSTLYERMARGDKMVGERFILDKPLTLPNTPFEMHRCYILLKNDSYLYANLDCWKPKIHYCLFERSPARRIAWPN